ncbi:transposase [Nitrosomonas supralitoralis]|uniref:transposase n=1 Tax=Nitrosomonas supralitoralis TaxID=2116706 RepID=UPI0018D58A26
MAYQNLRVVEIIFTPPLKTRPLEGTNNKIKTLHKMAYGFRDISSSLNLKL